MDGRLGEKLGSWFTIALLLTELGVFIKLSFAGVVFGSFARQFVFLMSAGALLSITNF